MPFSGMNSIAASFVGGTRSRLAGPGDGCHTRESQPMSTAQDVRSTKCLLERCLTVGRRAAQFVSVRYYLFLTSPRCFTRRAQILSLCLLSTEPAFRRLARLIFNDPKIVRIILQKQVTDTGKGTPRGPRPGGGPSPRGRK